MTAMIEAALASRLALLAALLALALSATGCALGSGPLASHGVDYIQPFEGD